EFIGGLLDIMTQQLTREEQERKYPEYTWDLSTIFESDEAFEKAFKEVEDNIGQEQQFVGHLADNSTTLYNALALEDALGSKLEKVYVYAHLKQDQDTANDKYTGFESRAHQLIIKFSSAWSFLVPEILQIDEATLQSFIEENSDLEFEDAIDKDVQRHALTQGTFIKCLESDDRVLRQSAYENLYKAYGAYNNTLSATLAGEVKKNVFNAKTHHYNTAREAALS